MEQERNIDKLAGYLIKLGIFAIIAALCWYFRSVLVYIIAAFVLSLIGQPVIRLLREFKIKGRTAPDWLLAVLTLLVEVGFVVLIVTQVIPVVTGIVRDASLFTSRGVPDYSFIDKINGWLIGLFPSLGADFDVIKFLIGQLKEVTSVSNVSGMIGSVASAVVSTAVGIFSSLFIAFFFIKDDHLFRKIIGALVPDRLEASVDKAILDIEHLLSRYFGGLVIEMLGVALLDFLGLWLIARIGVNYALGIAFIAGILNLIPYVGPLIGEVLGVVLCVILKYGAGVGLDIGLGWFALLVFAIMFGTQLVDNFFYQPVIYSNSIQSTPLEIFIVLLIAARIGGAVGMLVAIPAYTVVRVIAGRFYSHSKAVRRLMPDIGKGKKVGEG